MVEPVETPPVETPPFEHTPLVELTERPDGVLERRPSLPVPADQAWFWTKRWQERERDVDDTVAAGEVTTFDDGDSFLAHLDTIDSAE
ncbi:hypothetical protein ACLM5J_04505 [Nocardioides sp. Bht2]|uniref:hypothetical protein n=1 Tax=Nocardioides sp. Bht2 TaxID=3392297 RepID=UPI0039B51FFE